LILGHLEEAHSKMYYASILSNLSVNREHISNRVTRKTLENKMVQTPPIVKSSKAILLFLNKMFSWFQV